MPTLPHPTEIGFWVRRRYVVERGVLVPVPSSPVRLYDPFRPSVELVPEGEAWTVEELTQEPSLLEALANVDVEDEAALERFARDWGLPDPEERGGVPAEWMMAISNFVGDQARFREAVRMALAPHPEAWLLARLEKELRDVGPLFLRADASGQGLGSLPHMRGWQAVPAPPGAYGLRYRCPTLVAAAYLQLGLLLVSGGRPRACAHLRCGRLFVPGRRDQKYCRASCGDNTRQQTYRRRTGAG